MSEEMEEGKAEAGPSPTAQDDNVGARRDGNAAEIAELDAAVRRESGRRTRRSFVIAAAAAAGGYGFYRWIDRSPGEELLQRPLQQIPLARVVEPDLAYSVPIVGVEQAVSQKLGEIHFALQRIFRRLDVD